MPPRSIDTISVFHLDEAMDRLVWRLYMGRISRSTPITDRTAIKSRRNHRIRARYEAEEGLSELARAYGISKQRVWQIVRWTSG